MTLPTGLQSFNKIYPLMIKTFETFSPLDLNASITDKVNSMIAYLNQIGALTNDTVANWNKVMNWAMNDGLDEATTQSVNAKMESMLAAGDFDNLLQSISTVAQEQINLINTNQVAKQSDLNATNEQLADLSQQINSAITGKILSTSFYFYDDAGINNILNQSSLLTQLKNDGFTHINLCVLLRVTDMVNYNALSYLFTLSNFNNLFQFISSFGFKIIIKFHINNASGNSVFKNGIIPNDVSAFFASLQSAELSVIGSNVPDIITIANESPMITQNYLSNWQTLINSIRSQCPSAKISNSPTFDDIQNDSCVFWGLCDYIGANIYPTSTNDLVASVTTIEKSIFQQFDGAYQFIEKLHDLSVKYGKPYLITEIGIQPYETQTQSPATWSPLGAYNENVQANFYQAFLNVLFHANSCLGVCIWSVTDDFTFVNRLAEQTIINFLGGE